MSETLLPGALRAAIVNQRIYPPGSPIVEKAVAQILSCLEAALAGGEKLTLSVHGGKVLLRGKEVAEGEMLAGHLEEHHVQSLAFLPGVTAAEVGQLVTLLSNKKLAEQNPADWLKAQKVARIQIDKTTLVEILEGEVVMKRMDQLFEGTRDFQGLNGSLRDAYDMIDKIPHEDERAQAQGHMARKISGLQPDLLRDMFDNELPKRVEDSGLKTQVLNAMTQDKIQDIFSEIGNWHRQIRAQAGSEFEVVEHLNKLKSFLGTLLKAPASKGVPFALYEELLQKGLLDQLPPDLVKQTEQDSLSAQVDQILARPAMEMLEQPTRDKIPAIMKRLCAVGLDDLSKKVIEKILESAEGGPPLVRQMAARAGRSCMDILWANRKEKLWNMLFTPLLQWAGRERSADVYGEIAKSLVMTASHFILNQRPEEADQCLTLLRLHAAEDDPLAPKRRETAAQALSEIADNTLDLLAEDLVSQDPQRQAAAKDVIAHLGEHAVPVLVRIIKTSPDLRQRRQAADLLRYFDEAAKKQIAAELHVGTPTPTLLHLFSVLDAFLTPDLLPRFEAMAHFPDAVIRRRMVQILARLSKTPEARPVLLGFLEDDDEETRLAAVRAAGEGKMKEAVPRLLSLLKDGPTARQEEACLALGQIGDESAAQTLSEVLEARAGGFFKSKKPVEETVRVRAAWALGQIKSRAAKDALTRALGDPNLQIQSIAKSALGGS